MKAIMISDKPKWCAKIMNGNKTIEARKNNSLASAIKKLINENGYAEIHVYCTKDNKGQLHYSKEYGAFYDIYKGPEHYSENGNLNGKVVFKFRCYQVEEISWQIGVYELEQQWFSDFLDKCCLGFCELKNYLNKKNGYAIYISDLEIFDKPKELSEFRHSHCDNLKNIKVVQNVYGDYVFQYFDNERCNKCNHYDSDWNECLKDFKPLTKAPQNFCYVEVEK